MVQISQRREMNEIFTSLLSSEGYEVYMKKASCYVPLGEELSVYALSAAAAKQRDIFIGFRAREDGHYRSAAINPDKGKSYIFGEEDYFVVLSQNMSIAD